MYRSDLSPTLSKGEGDLKSIKSSLSSLAIVLLLIIRTDGFAQSTVTLKYFGLTIHPFGDSQAQLQPYKLDNTAHFVLNYGGFAGYEQYVYEDFISVKVLQGIFTDCSGGLASVTHVGVRGVLIDKNKHRLSFGIGPAFMWRRDWNRFSDYKDLGFFHRATAPVIGKIQYKLFPVGFEFEYDYQLNKRVDLSFSFTPGVPLVCTFSAGAKLWLNKEFVHRPRLVVPD